MRSLQRSGFIRAVSLVVLLCACALAQAAPSNKWRIQVSSDADSDGVVAFRIAPTDAAPVDVTVQVPKDAGENHIARLIRDTLRAKLGDRYKIEVDDGEDVLVKKRTGGSNFDLTITQKTVAGVRITLDRE
ncbi:hypothetical protein L3D22_08580 [Lysobacter soli]|jgi:hypothetical protein|uniref:hypothetical protein n=1 Tax=Lysobacter TaxID=68 RepID=UPI0012EEC365|nr:hypothetical protein [Lysobacter soli]MDG2519638.1 hypothetical protein [Lysobacter soli]QGW65785.1 hypothetical protein GOY17_13235 [Lysobacter soli]UTA55832.1 hypothetical protein L3D22_08580 [Lysobacter soli]